MNSSQTTYSELFRTNYSTSMCLSFLTDRILKGSDEGLSTGIILDDLQKAFHTINHGIVLKKLEAIRFLDQCAWRFWWYLCEQIFFIGIDNQLSDYGKISSGVPQGSILGSLMFLIYFNGTPQPVKSDFFCIPMTHVSRTRDIEEIEKQLNRDFENACYCFVEHKLCRG